MTHVEDDELRPKLERASTRAMKLGFMSALRHGHDLPAAAVALSTDYDIKLGEGVASDRHTGDDHLHAEVNAVYNAEEDNPLFEVDTLVTNLEPCVDCQNFLAKIPSLKTVAYLLPRRELETMGLLHARMPISERDGLPFEVVRLDQPQLYRHGLQLFRSAERELHGVNKGSVKYNRDATRIALREFLLDFPNAA